MKKRSRAEWSVISFALICMLLLPLGAFLNWLVMEANGGKMPVATTAAQVFFWIGVKEKDFPAETPDYKWDEHHTALAEYSRLPILADRIAVRFLDLSGLHRWVLAYLNYKGYPTHSHEGLMSVGDAGIFIHAWLAPLSLLLVLPYAFRDARARIATRKNRLPE